MRIPAISRLTLVTGKGGVGKTSVVAAWALAAAGEGRRPLIVELGHRASVEAMFATPIEFLPSEIAPGVHACNLEPDETLRDYVSRYVPMQAVADRILSHEALGRFFRAAPAVSEVAALARIAALVDEGFDPVIVDLDATGHALMMLELSEVFSGLGARGPVRRMLRRSHALLDAAHTRLHLVTLPGELPVQETIELYQALEGRLALGPLVVNRLPEPAWQGDPANLEALERRAQRAEERTLLDDCALTRRAMSRQAALQASLERLAREVPLPQLRLPELIAVEDIAALEALIGGATLHEGVA